MIVIGTARIEEPVVQANFACDLVKCKGACCTLPGGRGAPLLDEEIPELKRAFPIVKKYLPDRHLETIERVGFYEGYPGSQATTCIEQRACVFVYYEGDVAKCSLERAFLNGETTWRKPISCHLFPIRVSNNPGKTLRYEQIEQCESGRERGEKEEIGLYKFLKAPLTRLFGEQWYNEFEQTCNERRTP